MPTNYIPAIPAPINRTSGDGMTMLNTLVLNSTGNLKAIADSGEMLGGLHEVEYWQYINENSHRGIPILRRKRGMLVFVHKYYNGVDTEDSVVGKFYYMANDDQMNPDWQELETGSSTVSFDQATAVATIAERSIMDGSGFIRKDSVPTYADLELTYPTPVRGWVATVVEDGKDYWYDTFWIEFFDVSPGDIVIVADAQADPEVGTRQETTTDGDGQPVTTTVSNGGATYVRDSSNSLWLRFLFPEDSRLALAHAKNGDDRLVAVFTSGNQILHGYTIWSHINETKHIQINDNATKDTDGANGVTWSASKIDTALAAKFTPTTNGDGTKFLNDKGVYTTVQAKITKIFGGTAASTFS